jgi:hypothetical protein
MPLRRTASKMRVVPIPVMSPVNSGTSKLTLRAEMVYLVRLNIIDKIGQLFCRRQVAIVQEQTDSLAVRILVDVVNPFGVKRARPPNDAVYLIILGEEQFGHIGTILPSDTGD